MAGRAAGGLGRAMRSLGTDMGRRDAANEQRAFQEQRDRALYARQENLARLRNEFAVERQEAGWSRQDDVTADNRTYQKGRVEEQREYAGGLAATARKHAKEDTASERAWKEQQASRKHGRDVSLARIRKGPQKPTTRTDADGKVWQWDGKTWQPSMTETPATISRYAGEPEPPPGFGQSRGAVPPSSLAETVHGVRRSQLTDKDAGQEWKVAPHPQIPDRQVLLNRNGNMKPIPDIGPDWKVSPTMYGGATAKHRDGRTMLLNPGSDQWEETPGLPGQGPAPGGGGTARIDFESLDPALQQRMIAKLKRDKDYSEFDAHFGDGEAERVLAREGGREPPKAPTPTRVGRKDTTMGMTDEQKQKVLTYAAELLESGTDEQIENFWSQSQDMLKALDPMGLHNEFHNRMIAVSRRPRPLADRAGKDEFVGGAQRKGVPGVLLGDEQQRRN